MKITLSTRYSLIQSLTSVGELKPHLDKLPNLKSAYIESLVMEYVSRNGENLNLLHVALELGDKSSKCYDIANCQLALYEIIVAQEQGK